MAQVTIRGRTLNVYSEPSTDPSVKIGTLNNGDYIDVATTKIILSTVWARFSSSSFVNAWAIVKSPSANYKFIDLNAEIPEAVTYATYARKDSLGSYITGITNTVASEIENAYNAAIDTTSGGSMKDAPGKVITGDTEKSAKIHTSGISLGTLDDGERNNHEKINVNMSTLPPGIIQNDRGYPFIDGFSGGRYVYDYATDYSDPNFQKAMDIVRDSVNISLSEPGTLFKWGAENYNRFKVVNPNDLLTKAFPHVFFIRPCCELVEFNGGNTPSLGYNVKNVPLYNLYFKNCPEVIYSLVKNYGSNHNFMMALSNRAESFELKDRSLEVDTYGKSFRGNSVAYGRHSEKSKAAGEFSIQYTDDYDLHILKIHELWIDYIDGIKTGRYTPTESNIINKVLDYAGSVFYFLCGPDGETIIYCAKYTGVFPSTIPDSALNYSKGQVISNPSYSITYQYSWSEPDVPEIITDFNMASPAINYVAEASYQPDILSTGTTWVGAPYIEAVKQYDGSIQYKLRFRHLLKRGK